MRLYQKALIGGGILLGGTTVGASEVFFAYAGYEIGGIRGAILIPTLALGGSILATMLYNRDDFGLSNGIRNLAELGYRVGRNLIRK